VTCSAMVYDYKGPNGIQAIALKALQQQANKNPLLGTNPVLAGKILTQIQPQLQQDPNITFLVTVSGVWYYNWTKDNEQALFNKIKGKPKADAQTILNSAIIGVSKATVDINNNGNT